MITIKFKRQDNHKKPRLGDKWRKPKGLQSKMRLGKKGYPRSPSTGFGAANSEKGKRNGLIPVIVENVPQLEALDKEIHGVVIASSVGNRKRIEIVKLAVSKNLKILSVKDSDAFLKKVEENLSKRKKAKEETSKEKQSKLAERKKKADEKKNAEEKEKESKKVDSEEEVKDKEKKDIDKLLITKEV